MTITWTITQTEYKTANGFIFCAHWTATAVDEGYTVSVGSMCSWADGTATIPYADVTMQEVLSWCWASGVDKDATEAILMIELQKKPLIATGTPWQNS